MTMRKEAMLNKRGLRAVALMALVLSVPLTGCHNEPAADPAKLPNKDVKAGPPTASPAEMDQIKQHMQSGH
jgi:hypothetical protein